MEVASHIKRLLDKTVLMKRFLSKTQQKFSKPDTILKRLWDKVVLNLPKRNFSRTAPLNAEMPHPYDLATGLEKKEIDAFIEGNCDPYNMKMLKRGCGSADNPNLIPSAFNGRLVGCICKDNRFVNYMWLEKGCPKRCECGYWFKLKEVEAFS